MKEPWEQLRTATTLIIDTETLFFAPAVLVLVF